MKEGIKQKVLSVAENGVVTTRKITESGINRSALAGLVASGELVRCSCCCF